MKLVVNMDPDMLNSKLIALNVDGKPIMDFQHTVYGEKDKKIILEIGGLYSKGEHTLELLLEKGLYKRYKFVL
ncbi:MULTISPECIES: hypothetical protein [Metallosphaera]|uniref:Uncharacterized protein n=2 Tax=Metallosphaera TaxID=41980 RepID=A0A0K1T7G1_9CREN|nr:MULTISPECIES: hypothetical protein [Metallosphaera]AKV73826.1 hypothetical protein MsedA_0740 [Metallosphaera sedula]AKV76067.1 hypothetical protein MsedB_0740 [Metallosphaera sedula]AKV78318.1 hypothetical protein MsedC_0739 [Metallosphaera sedula]AKV80563.1 hypothetical protein MsedD_0740 [Metallosphaera sedula]AKV82811.1 hypothetical protein MsedE_0740 [Metallosphaera sedula]